MRIAFRSSLARQVLARGLTVLALTVTDWIVSRLTLTNLCTGWPLCTPSVPGAPLGWLQLLHRLLAGIASLQILRILREAWHEQRHHTFVLSLTTISALLFFGQIFVGTLEATNPAENLRVLHAVASISFRKLRQQKRDSESFWQSLQTDMERLKETDQSAGT